MTHFEEETFSSVVVMNSNGFEEEESSLGDSWVSREEVDNDHSHWILSQQLIPTTTTIREKENELLDKKLPSTEESLQEEENLYEVRAREGRVLHKKKSDPIEMYPSSLSEQQQRELLESEQVADYRDYCMYMRIVSGVNGGGGNGKKTPASLTYSPKSPLDPSLLDLIRSEQWKPRSSSSTSDLLFQHHHHPKNTRLVVPPGGKGATKGLLSQILHESPPSWRETTADDEQEEDYRGEDDAEDDDDDNIFVLDI